MTHAPSVSDVFSSWSFDPGVAISLALCAIAYAVGVRRARRWPVWRTAAFIGGLAVIGVALTSGFGRWDDRVLTVHMVQHVLLTMAAAPLLVLGAPERLALLALPHRERHSLAAGLRSRTARFLARPVTGWFALPLAMIGVHLPGPFDYAVAHDWAHYLEHVVLLSAAILFWIPVIGSALAPRRLSSFGRLGYLLSAMGPMGVVGAVLTATSHIFYAPYAQSAVTLGISALDDQQGAGAAMWVGGGYVLVLATLLSVWEALMAEERRARAREAYEDAGVVL